MTDEQDSGCESERPTANGESIPRAIKSESSLDARESGSSETEDGFPSASGEMLSEGAQRVSRATGRVEGIESRVREIEKQSRIVKGQLPLIKIHILYRVADLMDEGLTASQAVDHLALENGFGQTEWGEMTGGRARQTVEKNADRGRKKLSEK